MRACARISTSRIRKDAQELYLVSISHYILRRSCVCKMLRVVARECSKRSYRCATPACKSALRMLATEGGTGRLVELRTKDEYLNFPRDKSALYFTAKWCPPCRRIGPFFTELSDETPSVSFGKVDIDDNPDAAKMSEIMSVPTFKFFEGGQEVDQVVGADANAVEQAVAKLAEG